MQLEERILYEEPWEYSDYRVCIEFPEISED